MCFFLQVTLCHPVGRTVVCWRHYSHFNNIGAVAVSLSLNLSSSLPASFQSLPMNPCHQSQDRKVMSCERHGGPDFESHVTRTWHWVTVTWYRSNSFTTSRSHLWVNAYKDCDIRTFWSVNLWFNFRWKHLCRELWSCSVFNILKRNSTLGWHLTCWNGAYGNICCAKNRPNEKQAMVFSVCITFAILTINDIGRYLSVTDIKRQNWKQRILIGVAGNLELQLHFLVITVQTLVLDNVSSEKNAHPLHDELYLRFNLVLLCC